MNQNWQRNSGQNRQSSNSGNSPRPESTTIVYFDPAKSEVELYDDLAEKQADQFSSRDKITSHQLRRFFTEVKELYRIFESRCAANDSEETRKAEYDKYIAARFKMMRSKVFYAEKQKSGKLPPPFATFLKESIRKVNTHSDFSKFVKHFEAVVGFMYGKDIVAS